MDIRWIKLAVQFYKDEEIKLIRKTIPDGDTITLMFVMLLALAGEKNQGGNVPYTDEELSVLFDIPLNTVRLGLRVMLEKGLIDNLDGIIHISNWDKYQSVDGMERIREQNRERVRKHREGQKAIDPAPAAPALPSGKDEQSPMQRRFDRFWKAYPRKVGKGAAEKSFAKYKPDDVLTDTMIRAVETAKRSREWQKDGGQYIPHPATWLNQRRWEDELPAAQSNPMAPSPAARGLEEWD